jgi:hypothetical protein
MTNITQKDFVNKWITEIKISRLKKFPGEFMNINDGEIINLPGRQLVMGPEMFGAYEITDTSGNPYYQTGDYIKAKYVLYANRDLPKELLIPNEESKLKEVVKKYEKHLDEIVKEIENDFKINFPDAKHFLSVSNQIFNSLNLQRY